MAHFGQTLILEKPQQHGLAVFLAEPRQRLV
jgi:hypothetical protein